MSETWKCWKCGKQTDSPCVTSLNAAFCSNFPTDWREADALRKRLREELEAANANLGYSTNKPAKNRQGKLEKLDRTTKHAGVTLTIFAYGDAGTGKNRALQIILEALAASKVTMLTKVEKKKVGRTKVAIVQMTVD